MPSLLLQKIRSCKPVRRIYGVLLKWALKLIRIVYLHRLRKLAKSATWISTNHKVLVAANNGGIGDAVEATPLVQAIRIFWPKSNITFLTLEGDLFDGWCVPDRIIKSAEDLKGHSFNHSFFPHSGSLTLPQWVSSYSLGKVHTIKPSVNKWYLKNCREYNMDTVRAMGYKGPAPLAYVSLKKPQQSIPAGDLLVCLVPGSKTTHRWRYKQWPYFAQLARQILDKYPQAGIAIIGTAEDKIDGNMLTGNRVTDLRSRLSLSETAWVLKNSTVVVGNDCGPMHIADAVGTPAVVIFGPSSELKNSPRHKSVYISAELECRPCEFDSTIESCRDPKCMTMITADLVMKKIQMLLDAFC